MSYGGKGGRTVYYTCIISRDVPTSVLRRRDEAAVLGVLHDAVSPRYVAVEPVRHREIEVVLVVRVRYRPVRRALQVHVHVKLPRVPPPRHRARMQFVAVKENRVEVLHIQVLVIVRDLAFIDGTIAKDVALAEVEVPVAEQRVPQENGPHAPPPVLHRPRASSIGRDEPAAVADGRHVDPEKRAAQSGVAVEGQEVQADGQNRYHDQADVEVRPLIHRVGDAFTVPSAGTRCPRFFGTSHVA